MSHENEDDNLHISRHGVLSVDTEALRSIGSRLEPTIMNLRAATDGLRRASALAANARHPIDNDVLCQRMDQLLHEVELTHSNTKEMVRVFEYVEERLAGKTPQERWSQVEWWSPAWLLGAFAPMTTENRANRLLLDRRLDSSRGFVETTRWTWGLGAGIGFASVVGAALFPLIVGNTGKGVVDATTPLKPVPLPSALKTIPIETPVSAPESLAESIDHFPKSEDAQVRVEKYTMQDGSTEFVVYIGGTQALVGDPFDMISNTDLYLDQKESVSYEAVLDALALAGVGPDDPVSIYGHSQGAAIGSHIAASEQFNVVRHTSIGGPVSVELPESVTGLEIQHTNDPVALLATGGVGLGSGSEDSRVIQAEGTPVLPLALPLSTHLIDSYRITAEKIDALQSDDLQSMRDHFAHLGTAASVEATEYVALR